MKCNFSSPLLMYRYPCCKAQSILSIRISVLLVISTILPPARSSHYGINSVQFRGSLPANNLPGTDKENVSVKEFKQKWNHIQQIQCSCVACRRF